MPTDSRCRLPGRPMVWTMRPDIPPGYPGHHRWYRIDRCPDDPDPSGPDPDRMGMWWTVLGLFAIGGVLGLCLAGVVLMLMVVYVLPL